MRLVGLLLAVLALASVEDHEIFDLAAQIEAAEGKGTTFYSWLGIPSTASIAELNKAYRKKSLQLHPDKNPGVKGIHERFARLGVVASILRSSEGRERYDFFYKSGFPRWKGTGYYYSRFRPDLASVLVFLIILTSALQYVVQRFTYKRDLGRVEYFIREARSAAWGPKLAPVEGPRKVKVNMGGPGRMDDEGNFIPGRTLDMVVDGPDVFILESDGTRIPLDTSAAMPPSLKRTWFISLVSSLIARVTGKSSEAQATSHTDDVVEDEASGAETASTGYLSEAPAKNGNGKATATTMAGGRRRKAVRKR
ncbi:DnaJ-domain-containing protein [Neolentinus lepideus HHB14362 ss-1]|uniref:DnaJ-domain-containing protein n=1 Tax=Neolentinus lepideus HHB14362 ss-1 TaxID=1314782 RepID=A0A165P0W1_9AGAM|nr:DnaJ-domain-containing protein [Neolentinus lepideus HHB14362 ss-1]